MAQKVDYRRISAIDFKIRGAFSERRTMKDRGSYKERFATFYPQKMGRVNV